MSSALEPTDAAEDAASVIAEQRADQPLAASYGQRLQEIARKGSGQQAGKRVIDQFVASYGQSLQEVALRASGQQAGKRVIDQFLASYGQQSLQEVALRASGQQAGKRAIDQFLASYGQQSLQALKASIGVPSPLQQAVRGLAAQPATEAATTEVVGWLLRQGVPPKAILDPSLDSTGQLPDEDHADRQSPQKREEVPPSVPAQGEFSAELTTPGAFFAQHEVLVTSFESLMTEVLALNRKFPGGEIVWRGQQNSDWGLHSSLYREIAKAAGIAFPGECSPADLGAQHLPDENALVRAEKSLFENVARDWRMAGQSGLEVLARLQHHGGPTRLLDVTRSPLIAAWFAVEPGKDEGKDARLFAISATPTDPAAQILAFFSELQDVVGFQPSWLGWGRSERVGFSWGTGTLRRIWVPPAYDPRIAAQNAAFLVEGVPAPNRKALRQFVKPGGGRWRAVDITAATSVLARPRHPHRGIRSHQSPLSSIFSFRISARAKIEIRRTLEQAFGYKASLLYPDAEGLSKHLHGDTSWLLG